ncbi:MAG: hypothetical protein ACHQQP_00590, partial [Gemmatimonadales bacterium]
MIESSRAGREGSSPPTGREPLVGIGAVAAAAGGTGGAATGGGVLATVAPAQPVKNSAASATLVATLVA